MSDLGVRVEIGQSVVLEVSAGQILSKAHHGGGGAGGAIWQAVAWSYGVVATKKKEGKYGE